MTANPARGTVNRRVTVALALTCLAQMLPALCLRAGLVSVGFGPTIYSRDGTALRGDVRVLDLAVGIRLAPHLGLAFGALGADFHPDISEYDGGIEYPALQAYAFGNLGTEVNTAQPMWYGYVRGSPGGFGSSFLRVGAGMSLVVGALNPCAELTYRRQSADSDVRSSVSLLVRCGIGGWYDF